MCAVNIKLKTAVGSEHETEERQGNKHFRLKTETLNSGRLDSYVPKPKQMHIDSYLLTISILTASNWSSAGCILSWCHHVENASDAKLAFKLRGLFSFVGAASYSESCQLSICVWEPLLKPCSMQWPGVDEGGLIVH